MCKPDAANGDPAVFTGSLTLTFEGLTYIAASSSDGYDIDRTGAVPGVKTSADKKTRAERLRPYRQKKPCD